MPVGERAEPDGRLEPFLLAARSLLVFPRFVSAGKGLCRGAPFLPREPHFARAKAREVLPAQLASVAVRPHGNQHAHANRRVVVVFRPASQFGAEAFRAARIPPAREIPQERAESSAALPATKRQDSDQALQPLDWSANLRRPQVVATAGWAGSERHGNDLTFRSSAGRERGPARNAHASPTAPPPERLTRFPGCGYAILRWIRRPADRAWWN